MVEGQAFSVKNALVVESVNKSNTNRYDLKANARDNENSNAGYIILNQTYSPGWTMYTKKDCALQIVSIFTCNEVSSHVLAKNWANGWIIDKNALNSEYFIVFKPQYLQTFGYFFGALVVLFTIVIGIIRRKDLSKTLNSFNLYPIRKKKPAKQAF